MVRKWLVIGCLLVGMGMVPLGSVSPFAEEAQAATRRHEVRRLERRLRHEQRRVRRIEHRELRQIRHLGRLR